MKAIELIRSKSPNEEIDYNLLLACLQNYTSPRDVITRLLRNGEIIRVKKGLYVFGEFYRKRLISLEVLANEIYGPSYVSREFALQYYGLIPEGVKEITCMTTKRNKVFDTPFGKFSYKHIRLEKYLEGVDLVRFSPTHSALMASPEKALCDFIFSRNEKVNSASELFRILIEDYRIDSEQLLILNTELLNKIAIAYKNSTIDLLIFVIQEYKNAPKYSDHVGKV